MKKNVFILLSAIFLFSCGNKDENKNALWSVENNLDATNYWMNTNTLTKENPHSGLFSCKLDSGAEYGIGLTANFQDLTKSLPKKVNIHCWIFSTRENLDAGIVCDPNINNQVLNWQSFNLQSSVTKANEWVEIKATMDLPQNITPETQFRLYFWNPNKLTYFVDDLEISLE